MPTIEDIGAHGEGELVLDDRSEEKLVDAEEEDDDDIDETLSERLWGLTEMFPESMRNITSGLVSLSFAGAKLAYGYGRSGMWIVASSATILALPVMFETERAQMEEQQLQQQRQVLLGPNAAVSGGVGQGLMPQVIPPPSRA